MRQAIAAFRRFKSWIDYLMAWLDRRPAEMLVGYRALSALKIQDDPEAIFQEGGCSATSASTSAGLAYLQRAVAKGLLRGADARAQPAVRRAARRSRRSSALLADAEAGRQRALTAFREAGGERLLGRQTVRGAA